MEKVFEKDKLNVIFIGFQDRVPKIKDFIVKHNIQNNVFFDDKDALARKFGISYGAGMVFIDGNGIVKARFTKGLSEKKMTETITACLNPREIQAKHR